MTPAREALEKDTHLRQSVKEGEMVHVWGSSQEQEIWGTLKVAQEAVFGSLGSWNETFAHIYPWQSFYMACRMADAHLFASFRVG
jgi:hypothetical protein